MDKMNRLSSLVLTILFVMAIVAPMVPITLAQQMSIAISPSHGVVGTEVTVTGTIETYNGDYQITFDGTTVATGVASGYNVEDTITIPNAYWGPHTIQLVDISSGSPASAVFTVETAYELSVSPTRNYEGGPFTITITITGGRNTWDDADNSTKIDANAQLRFVGPDGTIVKTVTVYVDEITNVTGKFETSETFTDDVDLVAHGTYTVYLDVDIDEDGTFADAEKGLATTSFVVGLVDVTSVQRTGTIKFRAYIPAGKTGDKYVIRDPSGGIADTVDVANVTGPGFMAAGSWMPQKDATTGTYKVEVVLDDGSVYESESFTVTIATLNVVVTSQPADTQRTLTVSAKFQVKYPDGTILTQVDLPDGFTVSVYMNGSLITQIPLDPLVNYDVGTQEWSVSWKIPKSQPAGDGYSFNVTVNAVTDAYGNKGPENYASTNVFKVLPATLTVTEPSLVYPAAGQTLQRTQQARATVKVTYPDGSLYTSSDLSVFNVTVTGPADYTVTLSAEDYNADLGVWIVRWNIPWNAATGTYRFKVAANKVIDIYGNKGPSADKSSPSTFNVDVATVIVSNLKTDKDAYEAGEIVIVTFDALYPNGAKVTTGTATVAAVVSGVTKATETAQYDSDLGVWVATFDTTGWDKGGYNITLEVNALSDAASPPNQGPTSKLYVSIEVVQVVAIEIDVAVGSVHFSGETVNLFVAARKNGKPFDVPITAFTITVFRPDGVTESASIEELETGLYKISYTLPEPAPEGGYVVKVYAFFEIAPYVYARGYGIKSFSVSPTFNSWNEKINAINSSLVDLAAMITDEFASLSSLVANGFSTIQTDISILSETVNAMYLDMIAGFEGVLDGLEVIYGDMTAYFENIIATLNDISGMISGVADQLSTIYNSLSEQISSVQNSLSEQIEESYTKLSAELDDFNSKVMEGFNSLAADISDVTDAISALASDVRGVSSAVAALSSAIDGVKSAVSGVGSDVKDVASAVNSLAGNLDSFREEVRASSSDLSTYILASAVLIVVVLILSAATLVRVFRG